MLRNLCFCAVLITTSAFARAGDVPRCGGRESEHLPPTSNGVVFWNAVADNSIAGAASRHSRARLRVQSFRLQPKEFEPSR